jgi:hypothetical protein
MTPDKTLYLHIGCGKTGSSALQVWLNNEAGALARQGVDYPLFGAKKLDSYAITSGNGVKLMEAVNTGALAPFMAELAKIRLPKILLSSETFQAFTDETLEELKRTAAANGLRVVIIAYVRDVYDIVYSSYLQGIKRHLGVKTFREFASSRKSIQQFEVVNKYRRHFAREDIQVLHYDSQRKRGLEVSMCEALRIDPKAIPPMPTVKVNRSLDVFEAELLRLANKHYQSVYGKDEASNRFSSKISDLLIYSDPEKETEILLDEEVLDHLRVICQKSVDDLNATFLAATPLSMFNPEGKRIVRDTAALPPAYDHLIGTVITSLAARTSAPGAVPVQPPPRRAAAQEAAADGALRCTDPKFINALRDEAVRLEDEDLQKAQALMAAAAALRPKGEFITKKLEQYRARLGEAAADPSLSTPTA